MARQGV